MEAVSVGLIGTGLMGYGIGINLIKKGYTLHIVEHKNNKNVQSLKELGACLETNKTCIGEKCNIIILCLPSSEVIEDIIIGEDGLLNHLKSDSVIIDCSTSNPNSTILLSELLKKKNVHLLDAPLNRGPRDAINGKLNVMIGGDPSIYEKSKKIIESFAENTFYIGELSSGHKLKLLNNYISMAFSAIVISSLAYAQVQNLDINKLNDVMSQGSNYIPALPLMIKWLEHRDESIMQFSIENARKDLSYFKSLIEENSIDTQIVASVCKVFDEAVNGGFGGKMLPSLYDFFTSYNNLGNERDN